VSEHRAAKQMLDLLSKPQDRADAERGIARAAWGKGKVGENLRALVDGRDQYRRERS